MAKITIKNDRTIDEKGNPYFANLGGASFPNPEAKSRTHLITATGGPLALPGGQNASKPYYYAIEGGPDFPLTLGTTLDVELVVNSGAEKDWKKAAQNWQQQRPGDVIQTAMYPNSAGVYVKVRQTIALMQ